VEEGIVPGGGVALLKASKVLDGFKGDNDDQEAGVAIVRRALQAPIRQIAENAGVEGSIVVGKPRRAAARRAACPAAAWAAWVTWTSKSGSPELTELKRAGPKGSALFLWGWTI
jgi:hypothetical protein